MLQQDLILQPKLIAEEVARLARHILGYDIKVIWFGSWPKGTARPHADIDIAIDAAEAIPLPQMAALRNAIDDIATLHEIDLIDLHTVSETFREETLRHGILL
ncbi:MAG: nucleotidyltransferase domain-containing protein [Nitrospira sp.]|nr:nucleotidyltransferase domain-containing protein [Nitrospira sp.]